MPHSGYGDEGYGQGSYGGHGIGTGELFHRWRSHLLQELLNDFDETDVRVRENLTTLDAQLLGTVAMQLEDHQVRVSRELRSQSLRAVPLNIDNRGVYEAVRIPRSFTLPIDEKGEVNPPTKVEGKLSDGTWTELELYEDRLPVPQRIEIDVNRKVIPFIDPVVFTVTGNDLPVEVMTPALALPNRLSFWMDQVVDVLPSVEIEITGEAFPRPVWADQRTKTCEHVSLQAAQAGETKVIWEVIDKVVIHGLPDGVRLQAFNLPIGMPAKSDPERPFTHSGFRDVLFDRFWELEGSLLKEVYFNGHFSGREYIQSYQMMQPADDMVLEPNTNGMLVLIDNELHYMDRREPVPHDLTKTGLMVEPLWGLDVIYDISKPGDQRSVVIRPVPFARSEELVEYRYIVDKPDGKTELILPEGGLAKYSGVAGWRRGEPSSLSFGLSRRGTYLFTLETKDQKGVVTHDIFPYVNLELETFSVLSLNDLVTSSKGVCFDSQERLWIWTGSFLVPLQMRYDAYLFEPSQRTLFLTDSYSDVRLT